MIGAIQVLQITCWYYLLRDHLPFSDDRSDPGADRTFWHYFSREHLPLQMIGEIQVLRIPLLVLSLKRAPSIFRWSERSRCCGSTCWYYLLREHLLFSDDRSNPGAADPPVGAGKGAGALQGFLQQIHHLSQGQDAERESPQERRKQTNLLQYLTFRISFNYHLGDFKFESIYIVLYLIFHLWQR